MVLKWCFYVGGYLGRLRVSDIFGVRAVFGADASHVFPQSVLAVIPLIGYVVDIVVSRGCTGCEVGIPLCSMVVTTMSGAGSAQ